MKKVWKILLIAMVVGAVGAGAYFLMKALGLDNLEGLRQVIDNSFWGVFVFSLILIAQVIFLPAGTLAFTASAVVLFEYPAGLSTVP